MSNELGAAVVGAGYWGPNLVRNLMSVDGWDLRWVCDVDLDQAEAVAKRAPGVRPTASFDDVLGDGDVDAIAIATPASTHEELAIRALEAGKHVLVEKPLASSVAAGQRIIDAAERADRLVMADHTFCYTAAVRRIRELVHGGTVGAIQFIDSVRINLGLVQPDVDVVWDLGPHDLSILDFVLPADLAPISISAQGADPIGAGRLCIGYVTLRLPNDGIAHLHLNWLSPTKIRSFVVGGSRRTIVWDDVNPAQRLSVFDRGVDVVDTGDREARRRSQISYRSGDMIAPALPEIEALRLVVEELRDAILEHRAPLTDGRAGLRVLQMLETADRSVREGGATLPIGVVG
jgi:predicted dehydrogenase